MAPLFNLMSKKVKRVKMEEKSGKEKKRKEKQRSKSLQYEKWRIERLYIYTYFKTIFNICTYN